MTHGNKRDIWLVTMTHGNNQTNSNLNQTTIFFDTDRMNRRPEKTFHESQGNTNDSDNSIGFFFAKDWPQNR